MRNNLYYLFSLCALIFIQCNDDTPLEIALKQSGKNRIHWQTVLDHYSRHPADSLKYKAACFLISNMPGHGWYEGKTLIEYKNWIDSVYQDKNFVFRTTLHELFFQQPDATEGLTWYEDIKHLDSSFLIAHIDSTFNRLNRRPWSTNLTFEQWCEYLLPYRVGYEPPMHLYALQDSAYEQYMKTLLPFDDMRYDPYNLFMDARRFLLGENLTVKVHYKGEDLQVRYMDCEVYSLFMIWASRILLCPVALDFNIAFPNGHNRHCWPIVITNTELKGHLHVMNEVNTRGKIYRRTFSKNPTPNYNSTEYIPPFFYEPFYQDVTALYNVVTDLTVTPRISISSQYGYLCVFNDFQWTPVAISEFQNGRFRFVDIMIGGVYLPVIYSETKTIPVSYPFLIFPNGKIQECIPDSTNLRRIKLNRKYPLEHQVRWHNKGFANAVLEASNSPNFRHCVQIGQFETSAQQLAKIQIIPKHSYRYWRIRSNQFFHFGECLLYNDNEEKVIPQLSLVDLQNNYKNAFDDNPLSYVSVYPEGFVFDMGKPTVLSKVECVLRNDGNNVWPGHWYELLYHDSRGWISLGVKEAQEHYIEFDDVPQNALLWLRDLTTGKEESLFTYENGEMRFW